MARRTLRENHYSDLKSQLAVTERELVNNNDPYLIGYYNGLETILAKVDGRSPKLKERPGIVSQLDKALRKI